MECALAVFFLYLISILVYLAIVLVFVKPYYRDRILLSDDSSIGETRPLSNRNAALLDTFMYRNYYCYGIIYPLFIVIKIIRAVWFLIVADDVPNNVLSTTKDNDFKLNHW